MSSGVSVVICGYNSSQRLPETLAHLAAQHVRRGLDWEVVVIDNASTDDTSGVARACWPGSAPAPLRVIAEPQAGLSHARRRGFAEARYELLSFIDDDNWVCPEWVQLVADLMDAHPEVAACGGMNEAVCEGDAPAWLPRFQGAYAVGTQQEWPGPLTGPWDVLWGAGLSLRRSVWQKLHDEGFRHLLSGRKGTALSSCEDGELSLALRLAGWTLWYEPRLFLRHYLPAGRLQWSYLRRLKRGNGGSSIGLDPYKFALSGPALSGQEQLRQTWQWQAISALRALLRHRSKWARARREEMEGDGDVLQIEHLQGRLQALIRVRASYGRHVREVRHAPWIRRSVTDRGTSTERTKPVQEECASLVSVE